MARYRGPVCKLCRREGEKLFLKGARCFTPKCAMERRAYAPGQHGREAAFKRRRSSDYSNQLREKQKARRIYGVLERQFRRYYHEALRKRGITGENLLTILESRLDNVVYRMGFAESRAQARQLVLHGHFDVNGQKVNIPSMLLKPGDTVAVRENSRKNSYFKGLAEFMQEQTPPAWLVVEPYQLLGRISSLPSRQDIDLTLNESLIVEYYSR